MLSVSQILDKIIHSASLIEDIEVIWLYGSQAKGSAHSESDIDLAIAFKNFSLSELDRKLRPQEFSLIWSEQLNLQDGKLSIIDINSVPVYLAFNVVEYGQAIFTKNSSRKFKETQRIYSQYEFEMIVHKEFGN